MKPTFSFGYVLYILVYFLAMPLIFSSTLSIIIYLFFSSVIPAGFIKLIFFGFIGVVFFSMLGSEIKVIVKDNPKKLRKKSKVGSVEKNFLGTADDDINVYNAIDLIQQENFDEAINLLSKVNIGNLDKDEQIVYYSCTLYAYCLACDNTMADRIYTACKDLFFDYLYEDPVPFVYQTLGVYFYMKKDYDKASDFFFKAVNSSPYEIGNEALNSKLYLAMIYIKCGEIKYAKSILKELFYEKNMTEVQSKHFKTLCSYIEHYYFV